jgi:hypothetical protein
MNEVDWGIAEQNAYKRIQENNESIPVEEFLAWLEILKNEGI